MPPTAFDTGLSTLHDQPVSGAVYGDDGDNDPLLFLLDASTSHGTLEFYPDGEFTYIPDAGFVGDDGFTFTATDGQADSDPAVVFIAVTNSKPVAFETGISTPHYTQISGAVYADDGDNDELSFAKVDGPSHGTLTFNPDGSYTYKPDKLYIGPDSFSFKVNDGIVDSDPATVTINVEPTPQNPSSSASVTWTYSADSPLGQWLRGDNSVSISLSGTSNNGMTFEGAPVVEVMDTTRVLHTEEIIQNGKSPTFIQKIVNGEVIAGYTTTVEIKWSYTRTLVADLVGLGVPELIDTFFGGYLTVWMDTKITLTIYADGSSAAPVIVNTSNVTSFTAH